MLLTGTTHLATPALLSTAPAPMLPLHEKVALLAELPAGAGATNACAARMLADAASISSRNDVLAPAAASAAARRRILAVLL